jgi:acyl-CoA thioesterase I
MDMPSDLLFSARSARRRASLLAAAALALIAGSQLGALHGPTLAVPVKPPQRPTKVSLPRVAARLRGKINLSIIAFGSSSTAGFGASAPDHAYPAVLQNLLQKRLPQGEALTVLNRGIGGEDADDMLARLQKDVVARKPDLVIWQTGTNDPLRGVPLDRFEAETREGIAQMRAAGIEVILMGPQDCQAMRNTPGSAAYRDALRAIALDLDVPLIRRYDLIKAWLAKGGTSEAELMNPDGIHMADKGYALLAGEVADEILRDAGFDTSSVVLTTVH